MPITSNPRVIRLHANKLIKKKKKETLGFHYVAKEVLETQPNVTNTPIRAEKPETQVLKPVTVR